MALESFNAYHSYLNSIEPLNDAERGRLFTALLEYSSTGTAPELRGNERYVFPMMKEQIDRDKAKYEAKCAKNRENGAKGALANGTERPPFAPERPPNAPQRQGQRQGQGQGQELSADAEEGVTRPRRFTPPTIDEVAEYCAQRGNSVDAQHFVDFYTAKGWRVGSNPMKDWKAAVRTWEQRSGQYRKKPETVSSNVFAQLLAGGEFDE